jgi:hypothetical protein
MCFEYVQAILASVRKHMAGTETLIGGIKGRWLQCSCRRSSTGSSPQLQIVRDLHSSPVIRKSISETDPTSLVKHRLF